LIHSRDKRDFLFSIVSRSVLRATLHPIQQVSGALSMGAKKRRNEADHSPSSYGQVTKQWSYTTTLP